jgi:ribonuclease P protein component
LVGVADQETQRRIVSVKVRSLSQAFRPQYRLRKTDDYSSVFAFRKAVRGKWFMLHYRPSGADSARLGLVIAKRFSRRAVQRNFIKRIARDLFRHMRQDLPGVDLILRLSNPAEGAKRVELRDDIRSLLRTLR